MTGAEIAQIITASATLAGVILSWGQSHRNGKAIQEVKTATNGLLEKRVRKARAEGKRDEQVKTLERQTPPIPGEQPTNQPT